MTPSLLQSLADGRAALERGDLPTCEATCRAILQQHPDHPKALLLLGRCLGQGGRVKEALPLLQAAAARMPNSADTHYSLGMAMAALGQGAEAEAAYQRALGLAPGHALTYLNLGALLRTRDNIFQAIACFREAVAIDPDLLSARENLAKALLEADRGDDALAVAQDLAEVVQTKGGHGSPADRNNRLLRGQILGDLKRPAEAAAVLRDALTAFPGEGEILYHLGLVEQAAGHVAEAVRLFQMGARGRVRPALFETETASALIELGHLKEAEAACERAVTLDPRQGLAWLHLTTLAAFKAEDPRLAALQQARGLPKVSGRTAIEMDFALGRAFESAGDYPKAFAHYQTGNRAMRAQLGSKMDAMEATHEALKELYATGPRAPRQGPSSGPVPLFIVGMPRSGTTLVEQILASHPDVTAAGELTALDDSVRSVFEDYPDGLIRRDDASIAAVAEAYVTSRPDVPEPARYQTDKMPSNFERLGLIAEAFPDATIIHLQRHPLDSCLSCFTTLFESGQRFSYDLTELGRYYRRYAALMAFWQGVLPPGRIFNLPYEALVDSPETVVRQLLDHCGLDWAEACLNFQASKRSVQTASATQVRKPLYRSSMGRWRRFEGELAPLIQALGDLARTEVD